MGTCLVCSRSGWFLFTKNGMCKNCQMEFKFLVGNQLRILLESEQIVHSTKNLATKRSRLRILLENANALLKYEQIGVVLTDPPPSKIIEEYASILEKLNCVHPELDKQKVWHLGDSKGIDPQKLLSAATERKNNGEILEAVALLKNAYAEISHSSSEFPVSTFLRLPLYLQEAGDADGAWLAFNDLLNYGYPKSPRSKKLIPMDHSAIYDKMRLFLQREARQTEAVTYGVLSHLSWALGLHRHGRKEEFAEHIDPETINDLLEGLLKKAKQKDIIEPLKQLVIEEARKINKSDFQVVADKINTILSMTSSPDQKTRKQKDRGEAE